MSRWKTIAEALGPGPEDIRAAGELYAEYRAGGLLAKPQTELLALPDAVGALFYAYLEAEGPARSPVADEPDPSWMRRADVCYVSARACALPDGRRGGFIRAAKILPAVAANAIQLAPFHPCHYELTYVPEGQALIDPELALPELEAAGIGPAEQLRAFVDACHLLGKALGFELLPFAAQFGRAVLERPELFRWIRLDAERSGLVGWDGLGPYGAALRQDFAEQVRSIVTAVREDFGIESLKYAEGDDASARRSRDLAYYACIRQCIDRGLWPLLMNPWNGVGLPGYAGYDERGEFPRFAYRDHDGADAGADASGVVTPYAFYDGLSSSLAGAELGGAAAEPVPNDEAIQYYAGAFERWRDGFGFDFVCYAGVDRLLDSYADDEGRVPMADRPTPAVIREAIARSRRGRPGAGALALRYAPDAEDFGELGFDLVMGSDALRRIDAPLARDAFELYDRLAAAAAGDGRPAAVCFAVDAYDTGDPRRWGAPLVRLMGAERIMLRHAFARFASVGAGRRPMYETMGYQDLSAGLYEASTSVKGLSWAGDRAAAAAYAAIERRYAALRPFLDSGAVAERFVRPEYAWWIIRGRQAGRLVVAACSLETAEGGDPGPFSVPLGRGPLSYQARSFELPSCAEREFAAGVELEIRLRYLGFAVVELETAFF